MIPTFAVLMALAVGLLVLGEARGNRSLVLCAKPAASILFLVLGGVLLPSHDAYGAWLLIGLALSVVGDVLLLFPAAFAGGLGAFLLAHLAYIAAFATAAPPAGWRAAWALPVVAASLAAVAWLWPRLGRMRIPVLAYVAVITVMAWAATSAWLLTDTWLPLLGGWLFYLSDLAVARDRFVTRALVNRAIGLPAYYLAQLLLAASMAG